MIKYHQNILQATRVLLGRYIKHLLLHVNRRSDRKKTILNKILRYFRDTYFGLVYLRFQYILIVALGGVPLLNSKFNIPEAESSVLSTASFVDSWFSYLDYSHFIYSGNSQRSQPNTNARLKTKIGRFYHYAASYNYSNSNADPA